MNRTLRLATVFVIIATTLVVLPEDARACSCVTPKPHEWLARADAAFVGQVIAVPDEELRRERGTIEGDYVFRVDQAVKGDLPETITVRSPIDSAACGLGQGVGVSAGVFLRLVDGHWTTNSCSRIAPDLLLAAAEPLPEPDGDGRIVALASLVTPEGRTIALDVYGNTLAYGAGAGEVFAYALCPGDRTVIEHASYIGANQRHSLIGVRDLRGFHVVREVVGEDVPGDLGVVDIACLDPDGEEILLLVVGDELEPQNGRILRVRGDTVETVAEFPDGSHCNGQGAFDARNGLAYFTGGEDCRTLYRHGIGHGETAELARIPAPAGVASASLIAAALSPNGRYLAIIESPGPRVRTFRLLVADLQAEPVDIVEGVYRTTEFGTSAFWLASDRLLLAGPAKQGRSLIVNPQLEIVAATVDLPPGPGGMYGENVYIAATGGKLIRAPLNGGEARELRTFLDPRIEAFAVVPEGMTYDPAAKLPDNLAAITTARAQPDIAERSPADLDAGTAGMLAAASLAVLLGAAIAPPLLRRRRSHERHAP